MNDACRAGQHLSGKINAVVVNFTRERKIARGDSIGINSIVFDAIELELVVPFGGPSALAVLEAKCRHPSGMVV